MRPEHKPLSFHLSLACSNGTCSRASTAMYVFICGWYNPTWRREEINGRSQTWRQTLGEHGFHFSRSKTYMHISLAKAKHVELRGKIRDHTIPLATWFKHLESIIQNDWERGWYKLSDLSRVDQMRGAWAFYLIKNPAQAKEKVLYDFQW